jgi:hypothetical protein
MSAELGKWSARNYWQAIGPRAAIMWTELAQDGKVTGTTGPSGLVVHDDIDIQTIRSIPLSRMQPHRPGFPEFDQDDAPTRHQIMSAWKASAGARARHAKADQALEAFPVRGSSEPVEAFFGRVADYYRRAMRVSGQPVKALSDAAGVPKTTAARWVRQARSRGFLEKTTRGKGKA